MRKITLVAVLVCVAVILPVTPARAAITGGNPRHVCLGFHYRGAVVHDLIAYDVSCRKATPLAKHYYDVASPKKHNGFRVTGPWRGYPGSIGGPVLRRGGVGVIKIHGPAYRPQPTRPPAKPTPPPTSTPQPSTLPCPLGPTVLCPPAQPPTSPVKSCQIDLDPPTWSTEFSGDHYISRIDDAGFFHDCTQSMYVAVHFWLSDLRVGPDSNNYRAWQYPIRVDPVPPPQVYPWLKPQGFYPIAYCDPVYTGRPLTAAVTSGYVEVYEYVAPSVYTPADGSGIWPPVPKPEWLGQKLGTATSAPVSITC